MIYFNFMMMHGLANFKFLRFLLPRIQLFLFLPLQHIKPGAISNACLDKEYHTFLISRYKGYIFPVHAMNLWMGLEELLQTFLNATLVGDE